MARCWPSSFFACFSDQGIFANKFHGKIRQLAFKDIFGFKTLFQEASTSTDPEFAFQNALNQRKEVCTRESRAHCFPQTRVDCENGSFSKR